MHKGELKDNRKSTEESILQKRAIRTKMQRENRTVLIRSNIDGKLKVHKG